MILDTLKRVWGFDGFLAGQAEAVQAVMNRQDSLVIFPTGGGKSMTYQLPALELPGTAVVVSPLIALMQDQVSALRENGVPATALNSSTSADIQDRIKQALRAGKVKLLYVSPERLLQDDFLQGLNVSFFAIDEAHCISHWGHDFRPEYRAMGQLRDRFPGIPIHACTATATESVRSDIVASLRLQNPLVLVGSFDRPNLVYRALVRHDVKRQVEAMLAEHPKQGGVIYCIRKADVDELCAWLKQRGHNAVPYHAGLSSDVRRRHQAAFTNEEVDIVVATVAFGMGIDRSNVRYVIHTGMPKSIEHYQQEAGRAGRDGLAADCVLLYSGQDPIVWRTILGEPETEAARHGYAKLAEMYRFCRSMSCRHRFLVRYFGQAYEHGPCGACDVCMGECATLEESVTVARQILSGVAHVRERFGARHVAEVLHGSQAAKIVENGHHQLSTHGLLKAYAVPDIVDWIEQLVDRGFLQRGGEYPTLSLTDDGRTLMRGQGEVVLSKPYRKESKSSATAVEKNGAVFEALRVVRSRLAAERHVPPYVIFSDATLHELAAHLPATPAAFRKIKGVGEAKAADLGPIFLEALKPFIPEPKQSARELAFERFAQGADLEEVAIALDRSIVTVEGYLVDYVQERKPSDLRRWLSDERRTDIEKAFDLLGRDRLKPLFEHFNGNVSYLELRLARLSR